MPADAPVLTPEEMRELRTVLLWSFTDFSRRVHIPRSTLCEFETKRGNLKPAQLASCRKVLMQAMLAHSEKIARLVSGDRAA